MNENELLGTGNKAVDHAQKLGADEAEAFLYFENHMSIQYIGGIFASRSGALKGLKGTLARIAEPWIKKKGLPKVTSGIKAGVGVRVVVNKAVGFSSVSSLEESRVLETVEDAARVAKIRPPDPNWICLPKVKELAGEGGVFDKKLLELDVEEVLGLCADSCVALGDFDKRLVQAIGTISTHCVFGSVVNTNGIEAFDKGTALTAYFFGKAKSGDEEVSSGDLLTSRSYTEDFQSLAISAATRTIESLGKKPLSEKHTGSVLFENVSWNELFSVIFTSGISALNAQENRSIYKGKIGKQVADELVSITDDGQLPQGFGTTKMDDEGVPRQKTPVIENGILTSLLYDNYTAEREQRESTGNASRHGRATVPYANQPAISPSNLVFSPGKGDFENLISEVKDGVLVKGSLLGALHSNVITGDFSVSADNAFKIENGEIAFPLKVCTVAGNLYDALNHVIVVGDDLKTFGNCVCPSLIMDNIVVST